MASSSVIANLRIQLSASWDRLRSGFQQAGAALGKFRANTTTAIGSIGGMFASLGTGAFSAIPGIGALTAAFAALDVALGPIGVILVAVAAAFVALRAAIGFGQWGVQLAAEMERVSTSFEVLTGSANAAAFLLTDIREKAARTPFQFSGLAETTKTLLQFGIGARDVLGDLDMLSNIASGDQAKLDRLALAFGQAASAGRLMGQDLLQMINAGFNPLQEISQRTGESMLELRQRMSEGLVTFAEVRQAFADATSEGGRFYEMNERQSQTIFGLWSTLKDTVAEAAMAFGEMLVPAVRLALQGLIEIAGAVRDVSKAVSSFFGTTEDVVKDAKTAFADVRELGVESAKEMEAEIESSLQSFATSLTSKFASPAEKFAEEAGKIRQAFDAGLISAETYVKAMMEAKTLITGQVKEAKKLQQLGNVGYTTRNSVAGFEATQAARNAIIAQKRSEELLKQQLLEEKKANLLLEELVKNAKESSTSISVNRQTI